MGARPSGPTALQRSLIHPATYYAIRGALIAPGVIGLGPSIDAARRAGRAFGSARFNRKRVERAMGHIEQAMPELDKPARHELAIRSYEHLFELGVEMTSCARTISEDAWPHHMRLGDIKPAIDVLLSGRPTILITGHCGNWEVLGFTIALLGFSVQSIYRPLDVRPLDTWVRESRGRRGMMLLDKFGAMHQLPQIMREGRGAPAFVADQNAGDRALFVPYFGRLTSTYKSIGLLALEHDATLIAGMARRLPKGSGEGSVRHPGALDYNIEIQGVLEPQTYREAEDPMFFLTAWYRRAIEKMVLAAPEQYLWMHRMWKSRPRHERLNRAFPDPLREKLAALPWNTDEDVARIVDRSERDRAFLAEHGLNRMP